MYNYSVYVLGAGLVSIAFALLCILVAFKKRKYNYDTLPEMKNPMAGKKVIFVPDDNDPVNADGVCGHLCEVGQSKPAVGLYVIYLKRMLDIIVSFAGLVILSPVLLAIYIAIEIDDPGPAMFLQKRVGLNKEYFMMHKFRSMKMSTPHDKPTHMLENPEEYITTVGRFLRAHSLDELPQIWDIFIGNMSIIGPRPALWNQDYLIAERDKYEANSVRPGLTGWAQINGRDELAIAEKAKLDGEYVQKLSFFFDLKCFLGSFSKVVKDSSIVEGRLDWSVEEERHYLDGKTTTELIGNIGFGEPVRVNRDFNRKVLITGANSYIGESFSAYAAEHYPSLHVDTVDMLDGTWKEKDFSGYDVVYHVAGIAHADIGNVDRSTKARYYSVNTDMAIEACEKAKRDGVKCFVFMSSMLVYGNSAPLGIERIVEANTIPNVSNFYGDSKLQADVAVRDLADDSFKVIVLRPPMVYGKNSKGNYPLLSKYAKKLPVFPEISNQRSMLYIENLCEFLCQIMLVQEYKRNSIVLIPQNEQWVSTSQMVKEIAEAAHKRIFVTRLFAPFVWLASHLGKKTSILVDKAFGNNCYSHELSNYEGISYQIVDLKESIRRTERKEK